MDEKLLDLLDLALAERFQLSYASMRQEEPQAEKLVTLLIELSENIQNSSTIGQEDKKMIDEYLATSAEMEDKLQRYLYIQGAKECVTVLRELGVIK